MLTTFCRVRRFLALIGLLLLEKLNQWCDGDLFLGFSRLGILIDCTRFGDRGCETLKKINKFGILINRALTGIFSRSSCRCFLERCKLCRRRTKQTRIISRMLGVIEGGSSDFITESSNMFGVLDVQVSSAWSGGFGRAGDLPLAYSNRVY